MIPSGAEIDLALEPIDLRLSFDRLSGLAKEHIGYDARRGTAGVQWRRRMSPGNGRTSRFLRRRRRHGRR
jgi:hypothetical protein